MPMENEGVLVGPSGARPFPKKSSESIPTANHGIPAGPRPVPKGSGSMPIAKQGVQKPSGNGEGRAALAADPSRPSAKSSQPTEEGDFEGRTKPYQEGDQLLSGSKGDDPREAEGKNGDKQEGTAGEHPRLFSGILPADYTGICRAARVKQFARGEILHLEGDAVERVLLLTSGSVKITKMGQGGGEVILRLRVPGDVLGAMGLFSCGMLYCTTAQVFRACRALVWEAGVFKDLVKRYPVLHQNMVGILGERLQELENRFCEVATERVGPRVALQILRLLKSIGRPVNGGVEIGLTREELGQMTGTTLFTVSRLLSAWEARGVVKPCREAVAICDVESLRALAQQEE
jgi:CRP-like cAMP-binding protein